MYSIFSTIKITIYYIGRAKLIHINLNIFKEEFIMSLAELVRQQQMEVVTENNFHINKIPKYSKINLAIWVDKFADRDRVPHAARIKIVDTKTHTDISIDVKTFEVRRPNTTKELRALKFDHDSYNKIIIPLISRRAVHEALVNMAYNKNCELTPQHFNDALMIICKRWTPKDPDDYASDIAVFKQISDRNNISYIPIPLEDML